MVMNKQNKEEMKKVLQRIQDGTFNKEWLSEYEKSGKNAFETLVEAGYQPEIAYFEVLHELKLIVDMIQKYGINGMWRRVSETARYGGLTRGPMVMNKQNKEEMKKVLQRIQDGTFNKEWLSEYEKNGKNAFDKYMKQLDSHQIEQVGKQMRKMMWPDSTE
jgi:ketol-acid reductoisomerase